MIGPFIFFDHMGPVNFPRGKGIDVRPHPHIGIATVTYLFEGSILHRDNLGYEQEIQPGDINWMTAGKGIVHSERETEKVRNSNHTLHGLQLWVAWLCCMNRHFDTSPLFPKCWFKRYA